MRRQALLYPLLLLIFAISISFTPDNERFVSYTADPAKQQIQLFWKDDNGKVLRSIASLKTYTEQKHKKLLFAMNGGMYMEDRSPLGLYIENSVQKRKVNKATGYGNFYLKPNGIFYITQNGKAGICKTEDFKNDNIAYATQSGPLLLIDGNIHPEFKKGSKNLQIRNCVGILPDGKVLFAISKTEVNFYDFAEYFKNAGCKYALFLDGFVSRAYIPQKKWEQTDGDFGIMIGVTQP